MRILQLCNKIPYPPKDGGALATWNLARGLATVGARIDILSLNTFKHYVKDISLPPFLPAGSDALNEKISLTAIAVDTSISYITMLSNLLFSSMPYNIVRFDSDKFRRKLKDMLHKHSYDLIILEGLPLAIYIDTIKSHFGGRIIMRAHNVEYRIWESLQKNTYGWLKKKYYGLLAKRIKSFEIKMLDSYDGLISISDKDTSAFRKHNYSGPLFTFPFSLDQDTYLRKGHNPDINNILFLGALDWQPNINGLKWFLERTWTELRSQFPGLKLHIAGRNPSEQLKRSLRMPGIVFHGEVEDIKEFLSMGIMMIVPLFSGSGMRVKIIEGMAMGKVIIATSVAASGIAAENNRHLFIEDNPQKIIEMIASLIKDPSLATGISGEAIDFVRKNYDIFVLSEKLYDFLKPADK